jgi:hypothetical protein
MPTKHAIWKAGDRPQPLSTADLVSEQLLKDMIVREPRILSSEWMLIGWQELPDAATGPRRVRCDEMQLFATNCIGNRLLFATFFSGSAQSCALSPQILGVF